MGINSCLKILPEIVTAIADCRIFVQYENVLFQSSLGCVFCTFFTLLTNDLGFLQALPIQYMLICFLNIKYRPR